MKKLQNSIIIQNQKRIKVNSPIIVGLSGNAGVGKTITARGMAKQGIVGIEESAGIIWDHSFFALPIYEFASIRRDIEGGDRIQRQLYETMKTLLKMFPSPIYGAPDFEVLVQLTNDIVNAPIKLNSDDKPREFLQMVGDICREQKASVFADYIERLFKSRGVELLNEYPDYEYIMLVSDLRYPNEAEMIMKQERGLVIKLEASDEVRRERLMKRDGKPMTEQQSAHSSEQFVNITPFDIALDTNDLSVEDQILDVRNIILSHFNLKSGSIAYAN